MAAHNELGRWGEAYVANVLGNLATVRPGRRADLRWLGLEIEVKTARIGHYNGHGRGYQFCLHRQGQGRRGVQAPVVVLVCVSAENYRDPDVLVIPRGALGKRRKVNVAASFNGPWAEYHGRWELLADYIDDGEVQDGR